MGATELYGSPTKADLLSVSSAEILEDGIETAAAVSLPASMARPRPLRIVILMSDTGGGHRASAEALRDAFRTLFPKQHDIRILDLCMDLAGPPFTVLPALYRFLQHHPFLWKIVYNGGTLQTPRMIMEEVSSLLINDRIKDCFEKEAADVIISVHPLAQTVCLRALRTANPFVTVVTDLGGAHPTWFHPEVDACFVPSAPVRDVAVDCGLEAEQLFNFGLPVRQAFWADEVKTKGEVRGDLGMHINAPAILLIGGGDGVGQLEETTAELVYQLRDTFGANGAQVVVVCGRNKRLTEQLQERKWVVPVFVKGFVSNISDYMTACDILITKAGPGTIAEGLTRGLPILISSYLPGQEEGNVRFIIENKLGDYQNDPQGIAEVAVEWLSDPETLGEMSSRAREFGNSAATLDIAREIWSIAITAEEDKRNVRRKVADGPSRRLLHNLRMPSARVSRRTFVFVTRIVFVLILLRMVLVVYTGSRMINL